MTNEEKLEFIKANYKSSRCFELLSNEFKDDFFAEWVDTLKKIVPLCLYKYRQCNNNNLDALRNKQAWFSNPSTWNDPIDVTVEYNLEKDLKILEENFDDYALKFAFSLMNKYIESFCEQKKFVTADKVKNVYYAAFKGEKEFNPEKMVAYLTPIVGEKPARQMTAKTQEAFEQVFSESFKNQIIGGINQFLGFNDIKNKCIMYSVSETYTNNHQWAMYADGGKGFCIGYEIVPKDKREACLLPELLPIYYGEREGLLLSRILDEVLEYMIRPETIQDLINQETEKLFVSLHTKKPEWNGEQEWRFCLPKDNITSNLIDFDFAKALYLGENIEQEWKDKLLEIAKEQNLIVYQRKLDRMKSNWIYEKIEL